jgi:hypothetical protein
MLVMPSNCGKAIFHYWAGRGYPVGQLFTLERQVRQPSHYMPYAIDNGRYAVWSKQKEWDEDSFLNILEYYSQLDQKPRFVVVPDMVGDRDGTLEEWDKWYPNLSSAYSFNYAFCVQDGMTPSDVPSKADAIFVGGTFNWKWSNIETWTDNFDNVHVGRVNTIKHLEICEKLGVDSVDGTGWFRHPNRIKELEQYFETSQLHN